jgi:hypothetical protein
MRGPAGDYVQLNLFSTINIIAQSYCVEFAGSEPAQYALAHAHATIRLCVDALNSCSISTLHNRPRAVGANRTGWIAAWEAKAARGAGNALLVAACCGLLRFAARDIFLAEE